MVPVTRRELVKAWEELHKASQSTGRKNPHRLLLFYAVECGLKAIYLKEMNVEVLDEDAADLKSHHLNELMDKLRMGQEYRLPPNLSLPSIRVSGASKARKCSSGSLNQVWRYGSTCEPPTTDSVIESTLEKIHEWIAGEIR